MKKLAIFFLLLVLANTLFAQPFTLNDPAFAPRPIIPSLSLTNGPIGIGPNGMYAFWNCADLPVGKAVNNWTDRVSGIVLKQAGNSAPTNTALGVLFDSSPNPLTNAAFTINGNFTFWVVFRPALIDMNRRVIFGGDDVVAGRGMVINNGLLYGGWNAPDVISTAQLNDPIIVNTNDTFDIVDAAGTLYTNGVMTTLGIGRPANDVSFNILGGLNANNNLVGYVQYVGVWTNYQLTAGDVKTLDAWVNTNGVTNVSSGMLAWYKMDEGSGTTVADSSGNGHNGTLIGSPAWISGQISGALSFTGNGQAVDAGNFADGLPAFSTSFWIRTSYFWSGTVAQATFGSSMLDKTSAGFNGQGWGVFADAPLDIKGYVEDTNKNFYESPPLQLNWDYWAVRWHHVVCNYFYPKPLVTIYLDGALCTGGQGPAEQGGGAITSIANDGHFFIGGNNVAQDSSCQMDDVRIYNRPLSDQEIFILYRWRGQP